tara:strand:- start:195 stop:806 length:612 start_codon:yes stop_codon:yes gene_type:complete
MILEHKELLTENYNENEIKILQTIAKFAKRIETNKWFYRIGKPLSKNEIIFSSDYLSSIGFIYADPVYIQSPEEASYIFESQNLNIDWQETEDQLKTSLLIQSNNFVSSNELEQVFADITEKASRAVKEQLPELIKKISQKNNFEEIDFFLHMIINNFTSASHQASLVLAAGEDSNHPFAKKFMLFESGRIPIGITGNTFTLF